MRFSFPVVALALLILVGATASLPAQGKTPPSEMPPVDKIGGKTLDQWILDFKDPDPSIVESAIQTVMLFGSASRKAVPEVIKCLSHRDASVRVYAAIAIGLMPVEEKDLAEAVKALNTQLRVETQVIARFHVTMALGQLGTDARPAIPGLLLAAQDKTAWEVRKAAVYALGRAAAGGKETPPEQSVYPVLIGRLNYNRAEDKHEPSHQVRLEAAIAIGLLGPPLDKTMQASVDAALVRRISDKTEDDQVKIWSHMALMSMGKEINDQGVGEIAKYMKSKKLTSRVQAARALGEIGPKSKSAVNDLIALLKDDEPLAIATACWALSEIGEAAEKAAKALAEVAESHKDEAVRKIAKEALIKVKGKPKK